MERLGDDIGRLVHPWDVHLFTIGDRAVTLTSVLLVLLGIVTLLIAARRLQALITRTLAGTRLTPAFRQTTGMLARYLVLIVGFMLLMQTLGVDLTALNVLAGAVGVGVGFGLQNVVSNFISGFIVMLEQPVRIGDRIEIAGVEGEVVDIGARTTTLLTAQRATVIVPNQKFITDAVRNWDMREGASTVLIAIKAALPHDPHVVERLLHEVAREQPEVLVRPSPTVNLAAIGAGGNQFELQAWVRADAQRRARLLSEMQLALLRKLREHSIQLA